MVLLMTTGQFRLHYQTDFVISVIFVPPGVFFSPGLKLNIIIICKPNFVCKCSFRLLVRLPSFMICTQPSCNDKCIVFWWFHTHMGLLRRSGRVARVATLGNSANLHKSKMDAADGGGIIIFLLVNLQSRVKHVLRITLASEFDLWGKFCNSMSNSWWNSSSRSYYVKKLY